MKRDFASLEVACLQTQQSCMLHGSIILKNGHKMNGIMLQSH